MDAFMKEIGVGMAMRMMAKGLKPRLVISENGGKWTLRSETSLKTTSLEFMPNVEFDDTTADNYIPLDLIILSLSLLAFFIRLF